MPHAWKIFIKKYRLILTAKLKSIATYVYIPHLYTDYIID